MKKVGNNSCLHIQRVELWNHALIWYKMNTIAVADGKISEKKDDSL
jgi:hypothetical protein